MSPHSAKEPIQSAISRQNTRLSVQDTHRFFSFLLRPRIIDHILYTFTH